MAFTYSFFTVLTSSLAEEELKGGLGALGRPEDTVINVHYMTIPHHLWGFGRVVQNVSMLVLEICSAG